MPQRGDIVVERLTGKRAIVIKVAGDAVVCRFGDGRLEDRFVFELESPSSLLGGLVGFFTSPFGRSREDPVAVNERVRPLLRQPGVL